MSNKRITIQDIAEQLGLDPSTVSRALNKSDRVKESTKKLVHDFAQKIGYEPNAMAAGLRKGRSHSLGIIVPRLDRSFFAKAIAGIEMMAKKEDYSVMIAQSHEQFEDEIDNVRAFINSRVEGIIISVSAETEDYSYLEECQRKIPIIFFDRIIDKIETDKVVLNDFAGAHAATKHLIDNGCNKIVYFNGPSYIDNYSNRKKGYLEALKENNIPANDSFIHYNVLTRDKGYRVMSEIIRSGQEFDAVFACSDFSALGAMDCLKENGLRVPEDVAVVGFGNELFGSIVHPSLTSVEKFSWLMGHKAAELFFEKLKNPSHKPHTLFVEPELIVRESSSKITSTSEGLRSTFKAT